MTTHKTDFFREPAHFDYLVSRIIPELSRTAEVLGLTTAAERQVAFIRFLLSSRCVSADRICAGLQLTANATTGKKRMRSVFRFIA